MQLLFQHRLIPNVSLKQTEAIVNFTNVLNSKDSVVNLVILLDMATSTVTDSKVFTRVLPQLEKNGSTV